MKVRIALALLLTLVTLNGMQLLAQDESTGRTVNAQIDKALSPFVELKEMRIERLRTLDKSRMYRLSVDLVSFSPEPLKNVIVEYAIRDSSGFTKAGGSFAVQNDLEPFATTSWSALTSFGNVDITEDDGFFVTGLIAADSVTRGARGGFFKMVIENCSVFCENCAERASSLCTAGVATFNCICEGENRSCNFTCFPPAK